MPVEYQDSTVHERVLVDYVNGELINNPDELTLTAQCLSKMRQKFYSPNHIGNFIDRPTNRASGYDLADALVFMSAHTWIYTGNVAIIKLFVDVTPKPDVKIVENNALLKENLPGEFVGEFVGGNQDEDGYLGWVNPIKASTIDYVDGDFKEFEITLEPHKVPLEVGTIGRAKMYQYLHPEMGRGVARWRYGNDYITVYIPKVIFRRLEVIDINEPTNLEQVNPLFPDMIYTHG